MRSEQDILHELEKVNQEIQRLDAAYEADHDFSTMDYTYQRDRLDALYDTLKWCLNQAERLVYNFDLAAKER